MKLVKIFDDKWLKKPSKKELYDLVKEQRKEIEKLNNIIIELEKEKDKLGSLFYERNEENIKLHSIIKEAREYIEKELGNINTNENIIAKGICLKIKGIVGSDKE